MIQTDPFACIVDFSVGRGVPYDHRSVANTETCYAPNNQGRFYPIWRNVYDSSHFDLACEPIRSRSDSIEAFLQDEQLVQLHAFRTEEVQT